MSATANWSYTNVATIKPLIGQDDWGGGIYGEPYEISCTWAAIELQERGAGGQSGAQGAELVLKHEVFTEDDRPKFLDLIQLKGRQDWEEIRQVTSWDMSFFDEEPDFKLITG